MCPVSAEARLPAEQRGRARKGLVAAERLKYPAVATAASHRLRSLLRELWAPDDGQCNRREDRPAAATV